MPIPMNPGCSSVVGELSSLAGRLEVETHPSQERKARSLILECPPRKVLMLRRAPPAYSWALQGSSCPRE
jgi:hypothetical protein